MSEFKCGTASDWIVEDYDGLVRDRAIEHVLTNDDEATYTDVHWAIIDEMESSGYPIDYQREVHAAFEPRK